MQFLVDFFLIHLIWGFGLCAVMSFVVFRNRYWRPFRFGGDSPVSWGTKKLWFLWYSVAYFFEALTSFLMSNQLYVEFAMSTVEAAAFTLGLFLADRIAMVFEPEAHWRAWAPKSKSSDVSTDARPASSVVQEKTVAEPVSAEAQPLPQGGKKSWAEDRVENIGEDVASAAGSVMDAAEAAATETGKGLGAITRGVAEAVANMRQKRRAAREARRQAQAATREAHRKRMEDLTEDF